ncbi:MAG: hypothetical protein ACPG77_05000 [Nannocystaceae bacterium]
MAGPALDPEILDRLRRGIPLRMDRMGGFWLGDEPVTHPRVIAAFRQGLDISEAGEPTLHVGNQWCYIKIDDCPLRVHAVAGEPTKGLSLRLDDGRSVELDLDTLREENGLQAEVPAQRSGRPLPARFTNRAQMDLAPWLVTNDAEQIVLQVDGRNIQLSSD